jgi:hypothetical protein
MKVDLLATQGKLLETQVAQQTSSLSRQHGQLPPKLDCNPNASVKSITPRSGTAYDEPEMLNLHAIGAARCPTERS